MSQSVSRWDGQSASQPVSQSVSQTVLNLHIVVRQLGSQSISQLVSWNISQHSTNWSVGQSVKLIERNTLETVSQSINQSTQMVSCRFPNYTKPEPRIIYLTMWYTDFEIYIFSQQLVQSRLCLLHQDKYCLLEKLQWPVNQQCPDWLGSWLVNLSSWWSCGPVKFDCTENEISWDFHAAQLFQFVISM